jgi:penicillin-insensitive murein endopeptidase
VRAVWAWLGWISAAAVLVLAARRSNADAVRKLPARFLQAPWSLMSLSIGHPNDGWQARARRLRPSRHLAIRDSSRDSSYGHPALVLMLQRSARQVARAARGSVMLVGDLSRRDGGPLSGHRSHQSGRDADVGFYVKDARGKSATPGRFVAFDAEGTARDGSGLRFDDARNWLLLQAWVRDHRAGLSHVFLSRGLRARLLGWASARPAFAKYVPEATRLLKQPDEASVHDDHFHVRISCPTGQDQICREESR